MDFEDIIVSFLIYEYHLLTLCVIVSFHELCELFSQGDYFISFDDLFKVIRDT